MKLKSLAMASAAAILVAPAAFAADLPARTSPIAPQAPKAASVHSWAGPYVGAHAGYGFGTVSGVNGILSAFDQAAADTANLVGATYSRNKGDFNGFVGGLYAGYNLQSANLVYGLEGDVNFGTLERKDTAVATDGTDTVRASVSLKERVSGTIRGRLGYAMGNALPFVTAGIAFADMKGTASITEDTTGLIGTGSESKSKTHVGWTVGAGLDYAFTSNFVMRAEYQFRGYGKQTYSNEDVFGPVKIGTNVHQIRAGLAYKF